MEYSTLKPCRRLENRDRIRCRKLVWAVSQITDHAAPRGNDIA